MSGFLLTWERPLWSGRPGVLSGWRRLRRRYHVTDCRVAVATPAGRVLVELLLDDIGVVELTQSALQALVGTSTVLIRSRRGGTTLELADLREGPQLALVLQLLAADRFSCDGEHEFFSDALNRRARLLRPAIWKPFPGVAILLAAVVTAFVVSGANHPPAPPSYLLTDAISPAGVKRGTPEIIAFMQRDVMPVARRILGPLKGGPERVTCFTCHGDDGPARGWQMPAVQALPEPQFRLAGLERYNRGLDPQIRNAIYGYLAHEDKQTTAAYMRGVVMPEMARLLGRPAYDFTQSYEYNRARAAVGCYHCHQVDATGQDGG